MDQLRNAVDVMDRLYSPGGCPWDREQTHESLVRYLLEEAHELAEAIEAGDRANMREELGDVLFQVLFHTRIAAEDAEEPFTLDDVAGDLAAKLVRRHPHVFAAAASPEEAGISSTDVLARWEDLKQTEKARGSILEGIPLAQGALARAQKVVSRATRAGLLPALPDGEGRADDGGDGLAAGYGRELLAIVARAEADGVDAEGALRAASRALEAGVRDAETGEAHPDGRH
ncbi:MazG family protein [Antribacter sp. KLBMP9083]|uniref:MazG family protein n=1 Tax=Antribacter soli TaxID=2910976 RepID=A0AA41UAD1_9MICO|nr:MazG family protein [Antribacter soli]MCF4120014.1 MazG family protein [Antribacter soli]